MLRTQIRYKKSELSNRTAFSFLIFKIYEKAYRLNDQRLHSIISTTWEAGYTSFRRLSVLQADSSLVCVSIDSEKDVDFHLEFVPGQC